MESCRLRMSLSLCSCLFLCRFISSYSGSSVGNSCLHTGHVPVFKESKGKQWQEQSAITSPFPAIWKCKLDETCDDRVGSQIPHSAQHLSGKWHTGIQKLRLKSKSAWEKDLKVNAEGLCRTFRTLQSFKKFFRGRRRRPVGKKSGKFFLKKSFLG